MCGIYFDLRYLRSKNNVPDLEKIQKIRHRGPDEMQIRHFNSDINNVSITTAFHRLAIMDTSHSGMQPFELHGFFCLVNGEIWNDKEIREMLEKETDWEPHSHSDCEVIIPLFIYYDKDPVKLCQHLNGEYSFIIYDSNDDMIYMGTDELSVRPLFYSSDDDGFSIASEMKALIDASPTIKNKNKNKNKMRKKKIIKRVNCSSCTSINIKELKKEKMSYKITWSSHFDWNVGIDESIEYSSAMIRLREELSSNVKEKLRSDRDYGYLLSGGLDSSLVCALATMIIRTEIDMGIRPKTFTFGIVNNPLAVGAGLEELPEDVVNARKVAEHLGTDHHEYLFTMEQALSIIPEVIYYGETWDQTTIRASVPMYLGIREIKKNYPNIAVIYSGEVADELLAGYLYNHMAPSSEEIRKDAIRLLQEIHRFDGLRSDRMVAAHGCELRLPFFSKNLLKLILTTNPNYYDPNKNQNVEKAILRNIWSSLNILPEDILHRTKQALSDASSHKSGWKEYIKENVPVEYKCMENAEDEWYHAIFESYYEGYDDLIPHKWMPKWCPESGNDSSASVLNIHDKRVKVEEMNKK